MRRNMPYKSGAGPSTVSLSETLQLQEEPLDLSLKALNLTSRRISKADIQKAMRHMSYKSGAGLSTAEDGSDNKAVYLQVARNATVIATESLSGTLPLQEEPLDLSLKALNLATARRN
ncbi:hypothetical protein CDAR_184231 [Caerostris darwini]|uniref:Uncharacterized protein n=1 Tax=Caerostris darwini TaxID=1538125 RepID=A0AAV4MPJ0_9ARAC|nr:hypothetical protein CDAR_184231 [Caerostris darwini]